MPNYRNFEVSYTIPGQIMQKIVVQASDVNAARNIVRGMFGPRVIIGYIQEVK
jgi:hypothetical protein